MAEFPFPKFRDYGATPTEFPEVDTDNLFRLAKWRAKIKQPLYDDITGYWQFDAHPKSVKAYTVNPMHKTLGDQPSDDPELEGRRQRMPVHVAESAERAISSFWKVAEMRRTVLAAMLTHAADETLVDQDLSDELANYTVEAFTDYGYCLENPVVSNWVHPENTRKYVKDTWLTDKINSYSPNIGRQVLDFGLYALEDKSQLLLEEGISIATVALHEQDRRIDVWSRRYNAVVDVYPQIDRSIETIGRMSLSEIFDVQAEFPRAA
jgi:hypothetical protein